MRMARAALLLVLAGIGSGRAPAVAQVTRVEILRREAPALGGQSYGDAGQYEKIEGRVYGEVAPGDRRNRIITDPDLPATAAVRSRSVTITMRDTWQR